MTLHVDMTAKKVTPFPQKVMRHARPDEGRPCRLPRPEAAGRGIAMPEKR